MSDFKGYPFRLFNFWGCKVLGLLGFGLWALAGSGLRRGFGFVGNQHDAHCCRAIESTWSDSRIDFLDPTSAFPSSCLRHVLFIPETFLWEVSLDLWALVGLCF